MEVNPADGGFELVARIRAGIGDADRDISAVADVCVPLGELGLLAGRGVLALALALAGPLADPAAKVVLGRRLGHNALRFTDRTGRADELDTHRNRPRRVRSHQQRLQEHRSHVDPWPLRHPQRAMQSPVSAQVGPVLIAGRRPRGVRLDAGTGLLVTDALSASPWVVAVADRGGQTAACEHAGRCDSGAVEEFDQSSDLARQDRHCAHRATPEPGNGASRRRAVRVDLECEQKLVLFSDVPSTAD